MSISKTDILSVAGTLFSEQGYHGTTMREIARACDVKDASLYSHIKSKEEILWEIVSRSAHLFLAGARSVPQSLAIREQMKLLISGHLEVIARDPQYATVFFGEWRVLAPELRNEIKALRDTYEGYFQRVIEEGVRQGIFQVTNTRLACLFVLSALNWTYQWFDPQGPLSVEQLAVHYATFIVRALS